MGMRLWGQSKGLIKEDDDIMRMNRDGMIMFEVR